jgi:hypothetical protein
VAEEHKDMSVRAKAALLDSATATVSWADDPAIQPGTPLAEYLPLADSLGVFEALRRVAEKGEPEHLHTSMVSTLRGSVSLVVSLHRLPDGQVLMLSEHGWQAECREPGAPKGRPRHRSR